MAEYTFCCKIDEDSEGYYLLTFPDFSYGATDGETIEEALSDAANLLSALLVGSIAMGEEIPEPSFASENKISVSVDVDNIKIEQYI